MNIYIRRLQEADIPRLLSYEQAAFSSPWSEDSFRALLNKPHYMYLVALVDEQVAGICGMVNVCGEGDIDKVLVGESFRGQGIAQQMLGELLAWGEQEGIRDYTLEVRVSNAPAIRVYEKAGFVSEGVRPGFYDKPTEDALIMWRRGE